MSAAALGRVCGLLLVLGGCSRSLVDDGSVAGSNAGTGGTAGASDRAGSGGSQARAGTDGTGARGGTGPRAGTGPRGGTGGDQMCEIAVEDNASLIELRPGCIPCVCDTRPSAAIACTSDCWKLIACVIESGCPQSDTTCIRSACVARVGGNAKFTAAAGLAVAVGIGQCSAVCLLPDDIDFDAGP